MMSLYGKVIVSTDKTAIDDFKSVLKMLDEKYKSTMSDAFNAFLNAKIANGTLGGAGNYPALNDLPISHNGDIYLSGGIQDLGGAIIEWVAPAAVTAGRYYHGAALDYAKFDPTNLEAPCFQTAVFKGAGYESAYDWMHKVNVAVLRYNDSLDQSVLDSAQAHMDYYCNPANTNMQFGFFKNYADIFSIVSKSDNYYWYCTKVVWRIYNELGIDINSNSPLIDWRTSGLYSFVKYYYQAMYLDDLAKANQKLEAYVSNARDNLVLAEGIYYSPLLTKYYEKIRN